MVIRKPLRPAKPEHITVTPEGVLATLPKTPIEYTVTPKGRGERQPRYQPTKEECQRGFHAACESLRKRFPGWNDKTGCHNSTRYFAMYLVSRGRMKVR